jgi:2-deoxy-D-gluconate 3-dehydrogenase
MDGVNFDLAGKVAVVTGSGSGIGRSIAIGLAQSGADIVITELPGKADAADETAKAVRKCGNEALTVELDVREIKSIERMAAKAREKFDRVDILVNNAGVIIRKKAIETSEEEWDQVMNVNLKGVFFTSQFVAMEMIKQRSGKIINISSINGVIGSDERASYTASKAGVINLTRTLAAEWAKFGINVNAVGPTYLLTPLTKTLFENENFKAKYLERQPLQRIGRPEDILGAVIYLASSASDLVTGHTIMVDGGWTAV